MLEQLKEQWDNILLHVKEEHDIMDVSFNTWLLPLKIFAVDGNVVKILAPDAQMLRYIQKVRPDSAGFHRRGHRFCLYP